MSSLAAIDPARQNTGWANSPIRYLAISFFWLPLSLFWGMMLGQVLPARVEDFADPLHKGTYLGTISLLGAAAAAIIQLVIGPISDHCRARWGRRRPFLFFGTLGGVGAMLLFGHATNFVGLVVSYFFIQLLINIANGPYQAAIPDHVPADKQGVASSFMGVMQLIGEAGGPLGAGIVLNSATTTSLKIVAIQHLLYLDAALLLIGMAVSVFLVPDTPSNSTENVTDALREVVDIRPQDHPDFYWLLASRTVYNLGFYVALGFLAYYVQDSLHIGKNYHNVLKNIQVIALGAGLLSTFPAGYYSDHGSKKHVIYVSCGFTFAATLAFALAPNVLFATIMAAAFGIGFGIFRAADWAFACNVLPTDGGAAKYMAVWSLSATLPQVLAPTFGPVADAINRAGLHLQGPLHEGLGWRAAMIVSAICGLLGVVLVKKVNEHPRATTPEPLAAVANDAYPPQPSEAE